MILLSLPSSAKGLFASEYFANRTSKNVLVACATEEDAQTIYRQVLFFASKANELIFATA